MMNMRISRELIASFAFVDRNFSLLKRYLGWELVFLCYSVINVITIGFIMVGRGDNSDVLYLVIGALMWGFLSVVFHGEFTPSERGYPLLLSFPVFLAYISPR